MYSLIGLGRAGCNFVKCMESYPEYDCYYVNTERVEGNCLLLPRQQTAEQYEENMPDCSEFFAKVKDKVILVLGGSGSISACTLRILEVLKHKKIEVFYFRPDISLLSGNSLLIERAVFGILQEYARSAVFDRLWVIGNEDVAEIIGGLSIKNYYSSINDYVSRAFHFINIFENSEHLFGNMSGAKPTSRIATIGVYDLQSGSEKLLYDLGDLSEKKMFFAITDNDLENNRGILKSITDKVKQFNIDKNLAEFSIFSTIYDHNFCYTVNFSNKIQKLT
jgi:hypothetical protein